jgi:peroxiredoxin
MAVLTAAVIFVGILCLFDLLLSFALIRKLRHAESDTRRPGQLPGLAALARGRAIPMFAARTTAGDSLSLTGLSGQPAAFAFFAAECSSCREHLAEFAAYARDFPGGPPQIVAVVSGPPDAAADIVAALEGIAQIVLEPDFDGPVAGAFSIQAFPTFVTLDPVGRIDGSAWAIRDLPAPQPV